MDGGKTDLDSIEEDDSHTPKPPTDEAVEAIRVAVSDPNFMPRLVAYILRMAHGLERAYFLGYTMGTDLPGGMSGDGLAMELLERILLGKRAWDMAKYPDFLLFCKMHAKGMVQNLFNLSDTRRRKSVSPQEEADEQGNLVPNVFTGRFSEEEAGKRVQRLNEFNKLANDFLAEFALGLEEGSTEQKIILAVIDDTGSVKEPRDGSNELLVFDRPYMMEKLKISGKEFDAGLKRLQRKHKEYLPKWLEAMNLTTREIGGLLHE